MRELKFSVLLDYHSNFSKFIKMCFYTEANIWAFFGGSRHANNLPQSKTNYFKFNLYSVSLRIWNLWDFRKFRILQIFPRKRSKTAKITPYFTQIVKVTPRKKRKKKKEKEKKKIIFVKNVLNHFNLILLRNFLFGPHSDFGNRCLKTRPSNPPPPFLKIRECFDFKFEFCGKKLEPFVPGNFFLNPSFFWVMRHLGQFLENFQSDAVGAQCPHHSISKIEKASESKHQHLSSDVPHDNF